MTAKGKRLEALEAAHTARVARQQEGRQAYLAGLSDRELDELHVAYLRAEGHPDSDGEAARVRAEIRAMSDEDLRALIDRLERGSA
ncbi:hypothetical protein [Deinococcus apachensis]|uniref:hypothetical protein n=1 Tax=Deinococcus apachensis TaxID=309886 RepID=UPI0003691957|nr:hypothetical protein [Deinococcus apachensis]